MNINLLVFPTNCRTQNVIKIKSDCTSPGWSMYLMLLFVVHNHKTYKVDFKYL